MLLAARERGYRSLMRLNSRAFLETPIHQSPHIKFDWLEGEAEDLIALTGGPDGPIALALGADHAGAGGRSRCDRLAGLFGDRLYVELQRHGIDKERRTEAGLIDLAYARACRWSRPTSLISPAMTITRPTTRCCASPAAG